MKRRFFTISIGVAVPLLAVYMIVANGLFSSPNTILEDYKMHEKSLVKLFEKYEKESETMSDDELTTWQNEVNELSNKAAKTLIDIQKDPQHWKAYLVSTGQPYRPSPFDEPEYTGLAAKSPTELTSDELDAWWQARDEAFDAKYRAELIADGIWNEQEIDALISKTRESLVNDPERQKNREKMRNILLWKEARAREKAEQKPKDAEYRAWREELKAWHEAEASKWTEMSEDELFDETQDQNTENGDETVGDIPNLIHPDEISMERPTSETDVAPKGKGTQQPDTPFDPDAFAVLLSKDMSRWNDALKQTYPDVFRLDASFEQSLTEEARQYFQERQQRLQFEYVNRLLSVLNDTPTEHRAKTLQIVRESLSDILDRDFADSVLKQLQRTEK